MPELTLEIGGRLYEVACQPGQEASLERAAALLDAEANRLTDDMGRSVEKRMLLLAGLMLGDTMGAVEARLAAAEERIRAAEERTRIAEAKAAMLAANALKAEAQANPRGAYVEIERLQAENDAALQLLSQVLTEVDALAESAEARA
jgi:cell division protein ZapA